MCQVLVKPLYRNNVLFCSELEDKNEMIETPAVAEIGGKLENDVSIKMYFLEIPQFFLIECMIVKTIW